VGIQPNGQLGNGTFTTTGNQGIPTPAQITGLTNVIAISAAGDTSLALKSDGTVWAWGDNDVGQLGVGYFTTSAPYGIATPVQVSGLNHVIEIAAGDGHSLALRNDSTVWAWGANDFGQLGNGGQTAQRQHR